MTDRRFHLTLGAIYGSISALAIADFLWRIGVFQP